MIREIGIGILVGIFLSALLFYSWGHQAGIETCGILRERYKYLSQSFDQMVREVSSLKQLLASQGRELNRIRTLLNANNRVLKEGNEFYIEYNIVNEGCVPIRVHNPGSREIVVIVRGDEKGESLKVEPGSWEETSICLPLGIHTLDVSGTKITVLVE